MNRFLLVAALCILCNFAHAQNFSYGFSNSCKYSHDSSLKSSNSSGFKKEMDQALRSDVAVYLADNGKVQGVLAVLVQSKIKAYATAHELVVEKLTEKEKKEITQSLVKEIRDSWKSEKPQF